MVLFDLDICKCGIEGTVTDEGTRYCFVLTQSCVEAWLNSCINNEPVHPANAFPKRLHGRISKYKKENCMLPFTKGMKQEMLEFQLRTKTISVIA